MITRRNALRTGSLIAATAAARLNPDFFFTSAFAASGKTLRFMGPESLTGNWDPTSHTNLGQLTVEGLVMGYLTRARMEKGSTDKLDFDLATSLKTIDEFTIEVKLRSGVKFHDGKPFKAADVKATFEYGSQPDRPAQWYPGRVDVEVVDDLTCRISTKKHGYPANMFYFLSSFLPIMSAGDIADKKRLSARLNGTGPFKLNEQKGDSTFLVANPTYYAGAPKLPGVEYRAVGDATTRVLSLLNGEADVIERLEPEQADTVSKNPAFSINKVISTENKFLFFRCSKPPFNDERVRRAAAYAIDRKMIVEILGASGAASKAHISPVKFGYVDVATYPEFDPDKCQKLLAEAGFPKGKGLPTLTYYTSTGFYPKTKDYGEIIASMLQAQGFPVKLEVLEVAAWGNLLYDKQGGGEGHMIDCGWCTGSPEPDLVLRTHFHSSSKRICGIVDKEIDASLDRERNAKSIDERRNILRTDTLPLLAQKVPALSLFTSVFIHGYRKDLKGMFIYPNGMLDLSKAI